MHLNSSLRGYMANSFTHLHRVALILVLLVITLVATPASACEGPPIEPFCTKTLQLAIAGPPVILLPSGGTFDVSALVYLGLLDFPAGSGICPLGPYSVDVTITATCTPTGADGVGSLIAAPIVSGFNELTVSVTVPPGPPRHCTLLATATLTLGDGMVLTETADNVACLGDPAPGLPSEPRLDMRRVGSVGDGIIRTHPGDPATFYYEIVNNDPSETFIGTLTVDSLNESRMPGFSGPMPPGTAVISVSDPVEGDNFPIRVVQLTSGLFDGITEGLPTAEACVELPADPTDSEIPIEIIELQLQPLEPIIVQITPRHFGMCADGSCARSTLDLTGSFSDASEGLACSGVVAAADTSKPATYACDDSGKVVTFPPQPDPRKVKGRVSPRPDVELDIETELTQIILTEDDVPANPGSPFSGNVTQEFGRIQTQFAQEFEVDSFFDVFFETDFQLPQGGNQFAIEIVALDLVGAPTGFESTAPYVAPQVRIRSFPEADLLGFYSPIMQVSGIAIDNLGERRRMSFSGVDFDLLPGGSRIFGSLTGGTVEPGGGDQLVAVEISLDFRGFSSPELQGNLIFEDGFESGNISRWSSSSP